MANSKLEKSLGLIRKKIDLIDDQMLSLLEERVSLVIDAENLKKNTSKGPFYRPDREKEIIRRLQSLNNSPLEDNKIRTIFQDIISACFSTAFETKVAYLGPEGSFSEKAAKKHFGSSTNFVPCGSIREIIDLVEENSEYYGVLPIENSTEGLVNSTLDEIIESNLKICSEISIPINLSLISKRNIAFSSIKTIFAHSQAFAQSQSWMSKNLPKAIRKDVTSNSQGVLQSKRTNYSAAIASTEAAKKYDMKVLKRNIQDYKNNKTRFIIVGNHDVSATREDKTSISIITKNKSGALSDILEKFKDQKINLTNIQSRPTKKNNWEYMFFIELDGHTTDKNVDIALKKISRLSLNLKVLGSYPKGI